MSRDLLLFDDAVAGAWEPWGLTRPAGSLVFGAHPAWERGARVWNAEYVGLLAAPHLLGFQEDGSAVVSPDALDPSRPRIVWSSRAVASSPTDLPDDVACDLVVDGTRVGWSLPPGTPLPGAEALANPDEAPAAARAVEVGARVLRHPWDLVEELPRQLAEDLAGAAGSSPSLPAGAHVLGDGGLSLGKGVGIEPGVVVDTGPGPVVLADGVHVRGPARLEGPLFVGAATSVLGGALSASFVGPACKVRGEVEQCVLLGYDNKAHDGYLGHAYLGRWVNLGALTTNSDLKNNYGPVRVPSSRGEVDTELMKVGCFLGDHVKTAIGTLLNTGTVVGAGTNLFGGAMPPKYVPPFRWGSGDGRPAIRLDGFLETAERTMARRGVELTDGMRTVLERAWRSAAGEEAP